MPNIELTLVDLLSQMTRSGDYGLTIAMGKDELAQSVLAHCSQAMPITKQSSTTRKLDNNRNNVSSQERLLQSVTRFVRTNDQYLAFVSVLLKSRAYHLACCNCRGNDTCLDDTPLLPVVELPRTRLGKPFIPVDRTSGTQDRFPLSVSHQFPFAGVASSSLDEGDAPIQLGLDIVVYDGINRQLYNTVDDFIGVFRDSFTYWEWNRIHRNFHGKNELMLLQEFYIRWATKEAYTKALGVGMEMPFSSFTIRFESLDEGEEGLARSLIGESTTACRYRASVKHYPQDKSIKQHVATGQETRWDFFFLPLTGCSNTLSGCACVCATAMDEPNDLNVQWMEFEQLVQWHLNPL